MSDRYHVEFVCTGNTCRSPMAEGILKARLADRGVEAVENAVVTSSGIIGMSGAAATPFAVEVCEANGIDISGHRARGVAVDGEPEVDLYLVLAEEHYRHLLSLGVGTDRVFMLKTFPRRTEDLAGASIADPIGGDRERYEQAFLEIDEAVARCVGEIVRRVSAKRHEAGE